MNTGHVILANAHVILHGLEKPVNVSTVLKPIAVTMGTAVKVLILMEHVHLCCPHNKSTPLKCSAVCHTVSIVLR